MPSAAIDWAHWKAGVLSVKYKGGDTYDYLDVPEYVYQAMKRARSKGQFVNLVIKPNFRYQKRVNARAQ